MKLISSIATALCIASIAGHSNLHKPRPRGNQKWSGYCSRGQGCSTACDAPRAQSNIDSPYSEKTYIKRGQTFEVNWLRQNHPGGFVRIAMVPWEESDDSAAFDKHVVHFSCYETDCREEKHEPILGKNNGNGFGTCTTKFTIPKNLPDGKVTLQWMWYGGGIYYAEQNTSFAHYVNCADMIVQGDEPVENVPVKPTFDSRDLGAGLNGQCRYWSTNSALGCPKGVEDPETNKVDRCGYGGENTGVPAELNEMSQPYGGQSGGNTTPINPQQPVSPPSPVSVPEPSTNSQAPSSTPTPSSAPVDQGKIEVSPQKATPSNPTPKPEVPNGFVESANKPQIQKPETKPHKKKCHKKKAV